MEQNSYYELDIRELLQIVWKRAWVIVLIVFITGMTGIYISVFYLQPVYEASADILVNREKTEGFYSETDIRTNIELINTYKVIMISPRILEKVINDYNLNKNFEDLHKKVKVSSVQNSQVMSITVTDSDYNQAVYIANAISTVFQTEIQVLMDVDNVQVLAEAKMKEDATPIRPKPLIYITVSILAGFVLSISLIFLMEYIDNTLKTEKDVNEFLELPVLGLISKINSKTEDKRIRRINSSRREVT